MKKFVNYLNSFSVLVGLIILVIVFFVTQRMDNTRICYVEGFILLCLVLKILIDCDNLLFLLGTGFSILFLIICTYLFLNHLYLSDYCLIISLSFFVVASIFLFLKKVNFFSLAHFLNYLFLLLIVAPGIFENATFEFGYVNTSGHVKKEEHKTPMLKKDLIQYITTNQELLETDSINNPNALKIKKKITDKLWELRINLKDTTQWYIIDNAYQLVVNRLDSTISKKDIRKLDSLILLVK